jgi:hypothetical protein
MIHAPDNVGIARLWIILQQAVGGQDHTGGTEAALQCVMFHEGLLKRMENTVLGKPFDREHLLSCDHFNRHHAGPDGLLIHENRAGAAVPLAAAVFCAGQSEVGAQDPQEHPLRVDTQADWFTVNLQIDDFHGSESPFVWLFDDDGSLYIRFYLPSSCFRVPKFLFDKNMRTSYNNPNA